MAYGTFRRNRLHSAARTNFSVLLWSRPGLRPWTETWTKPNKRKYSKRDITKVYYVVKLIGPKIYDAKKYSSNKIPQGCFHDLSHKSHTIRFHIGTEINHCALCPVYSTSATFLGATQKFSSSFFWLKDVQRGISFSFCMVRGLIVAEIMVSFAFALRYFDVPTIRY